MFQVELAHWFYLDLLREENPNLPSVKFAQFCAILFNHVPFLRRHMLNISDVLSDFKSYKQQVPTYGAIILDPSLKKVSLFI